MQVENNSTQSDSRYFIDFTIIYNWMSASHTVKYGPIFPLLVIKLGGSHVFVQKHLLIS